jgi:riboflavin synthase
MFTGIVEAIGEVVDIHKEGTNITFTLTCPFTNELKSTKVYLIMGFVLR